MMRKAITKIHKWSALTLVVWLFLQVLSGLALAYKVELKQVLYPYGRMEATEVSLEHLLDQARQLYRDYEISRIEYPKGAAAPVVVNLKHRGNARDIKVAYLSAEDQLQEIPFAAYIPDWLFSFHDHVFLPGTGRFVVGFLGLALVFFSLSGAYLWWPARKRRPLTVAWKGPPRMKYDDLHRVVGILSCPVFVLLAVTGMMIVLRGPLFWAFPPAPTPPSILSDNLRGCEERGTVSRLLDCVVSELGTDNVKDIRFDLSGDSILLLVYAQDVWRPKAVDRISISISERKLLAYRKASEEGTWAEFMNWMYPVHTGQFLGWWDKIYMTALGAVMMTVMIFGLLLWWSRSRKKGR